MVVRIAHLVGSIEIVAEAADDTNAALAAARSGKADFADTMIGRSAQRGGCAEILTFDRRAAVLDGFRLVTASP